MKASRTKPKLWWQNQNDDSNWTARQTYAWNSRSFLRWHLLDFAQFLSDFHHLLSFIMIENDGFALLSYNYAKQKKKKTTNRTTTNEIKQIPYHLITSNIGRANCAHRKTNHFELSSSFACLLFVIRSRDIRSSIWAGACVIFGFVSQFCWLRTSFSHAHSASHKHDIKQIPIHFLSHVKNRNRLYNVKINVCVHSTYSHASDANQMGD